MTTVAAQAGKPWYREPWPWILFGLPGIVIVASLFTLWLAIRSDDGVVASDYYKRGLGVNAELTRSRQAATLGLKAEVSFDGVASGDRVRVQLASDAPLPPEAALKLTLVHPGHGGSDRAVMLARTGGEAQRAEYTGQFTEGAPSRAVAWLVTLETKNWRLDGQMNLKDSLHLRLDAAAVDAPKK